jgi:leucine dehydrogenase
MSIFSDLSELGHEQLVFCKNDDVGLRAIIGIHSTVNHC